MPKIDIQKAKTEREIPTEQSTTRDVIEYAIVTLVSSGDAHGCEVAKLLSAWIEHNKEVL